MTTLITMESKIEGKVVEGNGSGFFYFEYADQPVEGTQMTEIKNMWLITNRHVILGVDKEIAPDRLTFRFRKLVHEISLSWDEIHLTHDQIIERTRVHSNKMIDIAAISILDLMTEKIKLQPEGVQYLSPYGISKNDMPANNKLKVEVGDDLLVIGDPKGYHDEVNLYPIVKFGIIASGWRYQFDGIPYFLIDTGLKVGSSGSLVITKPREFAMIDGQLKYAPNKKYLFLGVYSERLKRYLEIYMGMAWYGEFVEIIVKNGIKIARSGN
jgi:hypothetical protein